MRQVDMTNRFEMVAKTFKGLEDVLAEELRDLGAINVEPGRRMVSFEGDLAILYKANMCCRTALRILKPFYKFTANDPEELYEKIKEYDWNKLLSLSKTFSIDTVANSDEFTHSRFVTYRVKDGIVDFFKDKFGPDKRPGVRLHDADVKINVHISGENVTLSLDSSGESLHKRGYRVSQTDAPINEVLAAGIILKSGWRGDCPFVDPMCGSGTFLIEAAMIGAGINPGVYRKKFAFEDWPDFDAELFDEIYNDDSGERELKYTIYGADISPKAVSIAQKNIKQAGVARFIDLQVKPLSSWDSAPENGILITNPPYGERIGSDDMEGLYRMIGTKLKHVFTGYHAWIIGYKEEYFNKIGLAPSLKERLFNGSLDCELREYVIFKGEYNEFRRHGGRLKQREEDAVLKNGKSRHFDRTDKQKDRLRKEIDARFRLHSKKEERHPGSSKRSFDENFLDKKKERRDSRENKSAAQIANEHYIRQLERFGPKQPSIRDDKAMNEEGRIMRLRKGWKK